MEEDSEFKTVALAPVTQKLFAYFLNKQDYTISKERVVAIAVGRYGKDSINAGLDHFYSLVSQGSFYEFAEDLGEFIVVNNEDDNPIQNPEEYFKNTIKYEMKKEQNKIEKLKKS